MSSDACANGSSPTVTVQLPIVDDANDVTEVRTTKKNRRQTSNLYYNIYRLGGCPLSGKSSMCMMCLKYGIILLIVMKNLWVQFTHILFAPGRRPVPR